MAEILSHAFMQRALIGGLLVSVVAGYLGPFIVQRRMAFLGSGLAHAAFGGVALGILLSQVEPVSAAIDPIILATVFTVLVALGIVWLREHTGFGSDTTIGIFFALSMALGIVFLSYTEGFATDAFAYLFGSLLAIRNTDLVVAGLVAALTIALHPFWKRWAYATFDANLAKADRVPVLRDDYLLTAFIAVAIVVSIKLVGIVLIAAFLVVPAACARLFAQTFASMTLLSVLISSTTLVAGLAIAYYGDLPTGPAIILTQVAVLGVGLFAKR